MTKSLTFVSVFAALLIVCFLFQDHRILEFHKSRTLSDQSTSYLDAEGRELLQLLRAASTPSRTVILTILDKSWARHGSVLDLFLQSFQVGEGTKHLLNHVIIVALDKQAFHYCQSVHPFCFRVQATGFKQSPEKPFKRPNNSVLVKIRNQIMLQVIQFGYNLVYTDADVMWLRNPFPQFNPKAQISIGCDVSSSRNRSGSSEKSSGGLFHIKSDGISIEFLKLLRVAQVLYPQINDYSMCEIAMHRQLVQVVSPDIKFIDEMGYAEFCKTRRWDANTVSTVHANCCNDFDSKIYDLKLILEDSKKLKDSSAPLSSSWRAPQKCLAR